MYLKEIQSTIQQIVVAISAVLKIEVEIADHELFRIAGTGLVKSGIWQNMSNEDFVYRQCLQTGKPVVIERPGFHEVCGPCIHYKNCKELGEICSPILLDGKVLGVIGLIAFTEEQRDRLFYDVEAKIDFMCEMAELIATKIRESELLEEQLLIERKLSTLIGYIDNGLIMIDHSGQCEFMNPAAGRLLNLPLDQLPDMALIEQFIKPFAKSEWVHNNRTQSTSESEGKLIVVTIKDKFIRLFVTYHPSRSDDSIQDAVIMLTDPEHMTDIAMKYSVETHKGFELIIGNHRSIQSLKDTLRKISNNYSPILIRGESGTGKEFIADCIHRYSERKNLPYISLNCAVLPEAVLDRQLFGSETKRGKLVEACGGTLFLDDIGDMPMSIQLKLLRVLEEKRLWNHGESEPIALDVRIITATDKDLEQMISKGLFRQDLFYKLSVIPLEVPPLRERKQDILLLANHFLQTHSQSNHKHIRTLSEDVKKILVSYHWPGNIRELSNIIEYSVNFSNHTYIGKEHLPKAMRNIEVAGGMEGYSGDVTYNLRTMEKETIERALRAVSELGEPKDKAAQWLGISRATFFRKLQQYELN